MSADAAFLRAIIERPDDDLPRLIYADFLDERGEPDRAEFVRLQCRLAVAVMRLPVVTCDRPPEFVADEIDTGYSAEGIYSARIDGRMDAREAVKLPPESKVELFHPGGVTRTFFVRDVQIHGPRLEAVARCQSLGAPQTWTHAEAARRVLVDAAEFDALRERERALLDAHGREWYLDDLARPLGLESRAEQTEFTVEDSVADECGQVRRTLTTVRMPPGRHLVIDSTPAWPHEFRRGFVDAITLSADSFLTHVGSILRTTPVTSVTLRDRPEGTRMTGFGGEWNVQITGSWTAVRVKRSAEAAEDIQLATLRVLFPRLTFRLPAEGRLVVLPGEFGDRLAEATVAGLPDTLYGLPVVPTEEVRRIIHGTGEHQSLGIINQPTAQPGTRPPRDTGRLRPSYPPNPFRRRRGRPLGNP